MGENWVKDQYFRALPKELGRVLKAFASEDLTNLMARAVDLAPDYLPTGPTAGTNSGRPQNPNRIKCDKCGFWHDKAGPCRTANPKPTTPTRPARPFRTHEAQFDELALPEEPTPEPPTAQEDDAGSDSSS